MSETKYSAKRIVLVVDDNPINRKLLAKILSDDYQVIPAENGKVALDILNAKQTEISLILLDVIMPVMGGYEFLAEFKKLPDYATIPVIVATQQDSPTDEEHALSCGATDFITKPYRANIIRQRVNNLIMLRENAAIINRVEKDAATGLSSMEFFYQKCELIIKQHPQIAYDMITTDIDNFKLISDMYSQNSGDLVLSTFAKLLEATFPDAPKGRIGADHFAILVPRSATPEEEGFKKLTKTLNKKIGLELGIVVHFGIYQISLDQKLPINTICDRALIAGKAISGSYGKISNLYDEAMRTRMLTEQIITDSMDEALNKEQFLVYYQPKYNLQDRTLAGAEALVRWVHPTYGFMNPGQFIPLFERNGFISKLDNYVWTHVAQDMERWMASGFPLIPISVNVSRIDIFIPNFPSIIQDIVQKHHIPNSMFHLEITESAYTSDTQQIINTVKELKRMGFLIEMDDFGTGYSSLNMLSELPIDILKLDMKFIQTGLGNTSGRNILPFVIGLSKWLNLSVIAEGVETEYQVNALRNMECTYAQGYFFSKPIPKVDFEKLLSTEKIDHAPKVEKTDIVDIHDDNMQNHNHAVVIIDDIELNRKVLASILRDDFSIYEASNGPEGLKLISAHAEEIDVVIVDLIMPEKDGFTILNEIKADKNIKHIPVIITSQSSEDAEKRAFSLGASDFLSKPYLPEMIRQRVSNVINSSRYKNQIKFINANISRIHDSYIDYLTGVYNRRGLAQAFINIRDDNAMQTGNAFFMVDIDNLKQVNDSNGHSYGDTLIRAFAQTLKKALRQGDVISRIGGDEFGILLKDVKTPALAIAKATSLCRLISEDSVYPSSCSIGVRFFTGFVNSDRILDEADHALYEAKMAGKNQARLFYEKPKT